MEAPVAGSILLAGIMLKPGGYGIYQISWGMVLIIVNPVFTVVKLIGGCLIWDLVLRGNRFISGYCLFFCGPYGANYF